MFIPPNEQHDKPPADFRGRSGSRVAIPAGAGLVVIAAYLSVSAGAGAGQRAGRQPTAAGAALQAPSEVVQGLSVPWSIIFVGDEALVSQRDKMDILAMRPGRRPRSLGVIRDAATPVDGGVLGLATLHRDGTDWIYAFHSTDADNCIVRMTYADGALGVPEVVFAGIPVGRGHNGGRIAFGPDGMLYVATGETRNPALSQDPRSLAGKILRMTPTGSVPADNPFPGSVVYSIGHRNPQGLAWDAAGRLWATEFGDKGWDELNRIEAGRNYGWPEVEGRAGNAAFVDPVVQWRTTEMGPSGLAYVDSTFFIAGLTGKRLWSVKIDAGGKPITTAHFAGAYGRMRDVVKGSDGRLWFVTNNTDGRGGPPRPGDDRIFAVWLSEAAERTSRS